MRINEETHNKLLIKLKLWLKEILMHYKTYEV